jgi:hypothetical protein
VSQLNRHLAGIAGDVGGEQPQLSQMADQRGGLRRDLRQTCDAAAWFARVEIDVGEPGDQSAAQQRKARGALLGYRWVGASMQSLHLNQLPPRCAVALILWPHLHIATSARVSSGRTTGRSSPTASRSRAAFRSGSKSRKAPKSKSVASSRSLIAIWNVL